MKSKILIAFLLIGLSGCATAFDVDLFERYTDSTVEHDKAQRDAMSAQANAIAGLKTIVPLSADPRDIALAAMTNIFIAQQIANIEYHKSTVVRPTLNTDNVAEVGRVLRQGIPIFGMMRVSESALENGTGETYIQTNEGGNISLDNTLNRTEVHSVANDSSSASTSSSQDSSKPVAFEPAGEE